MNDHFEDRPMSTESQPSPPPLAFEIQRSALGDTLWVHASDGSTVGRFSKSFGIDLHTTVTAQIQGASQCLDCSHGPAGRAEWERFRAGMLEYYGLHVPEDTLTFDEEGPRHVDVDRTALR